MNETLKWGAIQPLTGGMYIGAENAIGHSADWIISFDGFNKEGSNEYHLTQWLKKNNKNVPYYIFDKHNPFDINIYDKPQIKDPITNEIKQLNYDNMDLVVAVPVCSGLSVVTSGSQETKSIKNCNMLFITHYVLNVIRPKVYIFENAPTLIGNRGDEIRLKLEELANANEYSVLYYKTDTIYHNNAQKRPRTFVIFSKNKTIEYTGEHNTIDLIQYLQQIPDNATQQESIKLNELGNQLMNYAKHKYGNTWRTNSRRYLMENVDKLNNWDDFINFVNEQNITEIHKEKIINFIKHAQYKRSLGLNYMSSCPVLLTTFAPSVQFKSMQSMIHPLYDRLLTIRECLHLMGMPHDFELYGNIKQVYQQIGQNVPVKTAQWIVSEAVRNINNWEFIDNNISVNMFDNTKNRK